MHPDCSEGDRKWDWLREEPELRGQIRRRSLPPPPGAMGSLTELVMEGIVTGTIGTIAGLLAQSLSNWLTRPRVRSGSRTTITVTGPRPERVFDHGECRRRRTAGPDRATGVPPTTPPADGRDG
ncbi:MAG: effector-associated constant component EACC1 [Pseudonocardiaceae bacterium]